MTTDKKPIPRGHFVVLARAFFNEHPIATSREFLNYVDSEGYASSIVSVAACLCLLVNSGEVTKKETYTRSGKRVIYSATPLLGKVTKAPRVDKNHAEKPTPEGVLMLQDIFMRRAA